MSFLKTLAVITTLALASSALALQSDRQQPLEVNADSTDGTLGDGITVLRGQVDIQQGSLRIKADEAEVEKVDGRVRTVKLRGAPAFLEQEIESQGLVQAEARLITYQVGPGVVTLEGDADVRHPQYEISGDQLTYDLNKQHFEGTGDDAGNGRIRIKMDPEVVGLEEDTENADSDSGDPEEAAEEDASDGEG